MATVRMADYLRHKIVTRFKELYDKSNPPIEQQPYHGDKLYETLISGKVQKLTEQVEESFGDLIDTNDLLMKTDQLKLQTNIMLYDYEREFDEVKDTHFYKIKEKFRENEVIEVPLSSSVEMFAKKDRYYSEIISLNADSENISELAKEYIEKIKKNHQQESKRKAKRYIDSEKVDETLLQFTTLNQALKAWPALSKLVPQDKISKVHEKQQRKRKEQQQRSKVAPVEQNLNKTILTASLLGDD
tara:strand:- start:122 stop:853 length:732 start_codon:yes stop_codon:yes gene_type:complete